MTSLSTSGRQGDSVVRVGDLNAEGRVQIPDSDYWNEFVLGYPRGKFTTLCK